MIVNRPKRKNKMSRYTVMKIIVSLIITTIVCRLLYLQVFSYQDYKEKANTTATRFVSESAPRGEILDSTGIRLATNEITYSLTYTETQEVKENFYTTMAKLFEILDGSGKSIQDTMLLRLKDDNSMYFAFTTEKAENHNIEELRFKKDRGFNDEIKNNSPLKNVTDLNEEQEKEIDNELLKLTPEDCFYKLVKNYDLIELVDPKYSDDKEKSKLYSEMSGEELTQKILDAGYTLQDIKKFMVVKDIIKIQNLQGNKTITIVSNLDKDTILTIKQQSTEMPGIDVASVPIRKYPYNKLASSVLGYVSTINSSEKTNYTLRGYDASSDLVGKQGIESAFEDQLKGVKGGTTVKVNSSGRVTEKLFELESYPGNNVQLTIDAGLQWASEHALKDTIDTIRTEGHDNLGHTYKNATKGALITVDVKTGKILSLVSYPDYDPNKFTVPGTLTEEERKKYFAPDMNEYGEELLKNTGWNIPLETLFPNGEDKYDLYPKPFYNYATQALIPPGSTFKPLTGIAGLESGAMTVNDKISSAGIFNFHDDFMHNSKNAPTCLGMSQGGHQNVDIKKALAVSCNIYFYETAYRMYHQAIDQGKTTEEALDSLAHYAWQFGLGVDPNDKNTKKSTGIEITENFGQTFNFKSYKADALLYFKYEFVQYLEEGNYKGIVTFVPFDIETNEDDIEEVKNSKAKIKTLVKDALDSVGTDKVSDEQELTKEVKKEVQNIMKYSDKYKSNVSAAQAAGKNVNLDSEANQVTNVIVRYAINDKPTEIKSMGALISASIGQGMNNFTPLQLAGYVSTIANGGTRYKLHLVDKVTDIEGNVVEEFGKEVLNEINISDTTMNAIKEGMINVNNADEGTAKAKFAGFPDQIVTAGKTGSADFREDQYDIGRAPYATYVSFAPANDPEIAVVAVVVDGGHGGYAAQAVRGVYDYYFRDRIIAINPNYASISPSYQKYVVENEILNKDKKEEDANAKTDNTKNSENAVNADSESKKNETTTTQNSNNTSIQNNQNTKKKTGTTAIKKEAETKKNQTTSTVNKNKTTN